MLHMSRKARSAIAEAGVVIGYSTYLKLLRSLLHGKEVVAYGMTQEVERAQQAVQEALKGNSVCVISSGDAGVYGMAGVILEVLKKEDAKKIDIEMVPGIIAAVSCASLLGAPLMNDFAAISLSDLLTSWKEIEGRIHAAARSNFIIVLYNPKSKTRTKPLAKTWKILKKYRPDETPVGIVKNAYREGQVVKIISLKDAPSFTGIDMATTIIVGNPKTYVKNGFMITPRGYPLKR